MGTMASALSGIVLFVGGIGGAVMATNVLRRWPGVGLFAVGVAAMLAWEFPALPSLASVAGFQVKPEDAVALALAIDLITRPQRFLARTRKYNLLMFLTVVCIVAALVGGLFTFGAPKAINEARTTFWGVILTAWLLNQDWSSETFQRTFRRWATWLGIGLSALFVYHVKAYGLGAADSFVTSTDGIEQTGRPLVSSQAALLACIGFFMLQGSDQKRASGKHIALGLAFLMVAALCQHRSVWAAVGVAIALNLLRLRGPALARTILLAYFVGTAIAVLFLLGALDGMIGSLTHSLESTGTYTARVDSWDILVKDSMDRGPWSVLFGEPFGFGSARISGTQIVTFAPHNWYVSVFLRLGLVGLAAFFLTLLITLVPLLRRRDGILPAIVVATICVYMWTYSLSWFMTPMLAWGIAFREVPEPEKPKAKREASVPPGYRNLASRTRGAGLSEPAGEVRADVDVALA